MTRPSRAALPLLLAASFALPVRAQAPPASPAAAEANRAYQAKDWAAATRAYDALVKETPGNPLFRYRLGVSLLGLGQAKDALAALAPARQAPGPIGGMVNFGIARAESRLGEKERALEALGKASAAGFAQVALLDSEADLLPLRDDPRFKEAVAEADRNARPCVYRPEARAFDFWVGDWEVTGPAGPAGESHVEKILGECVIFENWTGAAGYVGKSFNFYDVPKKRWQQTWVDNVGGSLDFHGDVRDGNLYFEGEGVPAGQTDPVKNKMTFSKLGPDDVRQLIEQSTDGGKTWTVTFDGHYHRKK